MTENTPNQSPNPDQYSLRNEFDQHDPGYVGEQPQQPSPPSEPAVDISNSNPWLWITGILAGLTFIIGIVIYADNAPDDSAFGDEGDPLMQLAGMTVVGAGLTIAALWLVAGAVCWQVRHSGEQR